MDTNDSIAPYLGDIPADLARAAHNGTSWTPEQRGPQEIGMYARQLAHDYAELAKLATTDAKRADLAREFERYRAGYRTRYVARLSAMSRCVSTAITGGSNFNVRRAEKANRSAEARTTDLIEYRKRAIAAIRRTLTPELQPIMAGDGDAITRLDAQIEKAERTQALMAASNAAIRKKAGPEAQIAALVALGHPRGVAVSLLQADDMGRIGFASYQLTNNGANIRRMKERRAAIATAKETPATECAGAVARLEDCPADNRVRLFFPGKPDADVRARLKSAGFRWSPTIGAWQAYRNPRSIEVARREAGAPTAAEERAERLAVGDFTADDIHGDAP